MRRHYQNFAFDLYGTLVDIHAEEDDPALWYHLSLYLNFRGIPFEQEELRRLYWRENDRLQMETDEALEKQGLSGPGEPEIRKVWAALFSMKNHETNDMEIEDICRLFRALSNVYFGFDFLVNLHIPGSVYNMLPYIISLVVLALLSKNSAAPKAEGIPYDKGSR